MQDLNFVLHALGSAHGDLKASFRAMSYTLTLPQNLNPWRDDFNETVENICKRRDSTALNHVATVFHEMNHLAVLVGSAFGLASLLAIEETILSFLRCAPSPSLSREAQFQNLVQYSSEKRRFEFYYADELSNRGAWRLTGEWKLSGDLCLFSPLPRIGKLSEMHGQLPTSIPGRVVQNRYAEEIWFSRRTATGFEVTKLNTASLYEALAILTDCTTVADAMPWFAFTDILLSLLPDLDDIYGAAIRIYRTFTDLPLDEINVILPAVIDIALMQELYHENTSAAAQALSKGIRTPAAYLLTGLEAAGRLGPFTAFRQRLSAPCDRHKAAELYQDALCGLMGLPTTRTVATAILGALREQATPGLFVDPDGDLLDLAIAPAIFADYGTIDFRIPLAMHIRGLQARLRLDGLFVRMLHRSGLREVFDLCLQDTILVDPETDQIVRRSRLPLSVLAPQALLDLLDDVPHAHCPYQDGKPFYCGTALDSLCSNSATDPQHTLQLCPFYLLATILEEPKGDLAIVHALRAGGLPWRGCRVVRSRK
jgi:hypothetical protein